MELKEAQIHTIMYKKDNEAPKERKIVPSYVPFHNVRAIDISELSQSDAGEMVELMKEYRQYYTDFVSKAFNFEQWVEHTKNKTITPKWRSFKTTGIKDVK